MSENKNDASVHDAKMMINYVPGEECRVAIVEDGKLEEYYVEKFANASRVGNIYVGKVMNVEPSIQAAFVDFGVGDNGFLHVSDLHPRYFPGEDTETTERVGLKTPRRERPPIQACLRRGDEVIVQVLKEGVGTKGPTLTSYLSIPGRFLVMMPHMEKSGVSRKVEDEDQRRKMREILDQLDLPDGFGFIVRTAGMDRTKMELKRDLAYLQRLWKDMDRRLKGGSKPRLLYSESDLLVRSLRDLLTADINEVVIDHEFALKRAARFMKIVSPRGQAQLLHYTGGTPIFHTFGIEQQIALIHAREVPLPSGGRLVIDQTEALVAIDVNSGKSRDSRDAETNAYQTNVEAVDEICRQLRLRDMGGIVINDLIDMRHASHRKDIENRFKERLKRDRARSTVLSISDFGILELTRQRMRASHESMHFTDCPTCRGRGMVQKPDSIASDALRDLAAVLDVPSVAKVEMAVAPRVAGELLSTKRQLLSRIERTSGKHVDVRVSESVAVDRVSFYAYDAQGADIDLNNLPRPKREQALVEFKFAVEDGDESWAHDVDDEKKLLAAMEPADDVVESEQDVHPIELDDAADAPSSIPDDGHAQQGDQGSRGGRRRRRGRRGRGGDRGPDSREQRGQLAARVPRDEQPTQLDRAVEAGRDAADSTDAEAASPVTNSQPAAGSVQTGTGVDPDDPSRQDEGGGRRRRRRRRRGGRGRPDGLHAPHGDGDRRVGVESLTGENTTRSGNGQRTPLSIPDGPLNPSLLAGDHGDDEDSALYTAAQRSLNDTDAPEHSRPLANPQRDGTVSVTETRQGGETDGLTQSGDQQTPSAGGGRRRRRRRGRGGRGANDSGQTQSLGHSPRSETSHSQPQRSEPKPAPTVMVSSKPAPRTLYGGSRRKLSASELNTRPKKE